MTQTTTESNPVIEALSTEALQKALEARGLIVKPAKVKVEKAEKVEKTDEEILLEGLSNVVTVVNGVIVVIPVTERAEGSEPAALFEALALKSRTTLDKIEKAKRPAYTGAKRGPKAKTDDAPQTPEAPAPEVQA